MLSGFCQEIGMQVFRPCMDDNTDFPLTHKTPNIVVGVVHILRVRVGHWVLRQPHLRPPSLSNAKLLTIKHALDLKRHFDHGNGETGFLPGAHAKHKGRLESVATSNRRGRG